MGAARTVPHFPLDLPLATNEDRIEVSRGRVAEIRSMAEAGEIESVSADFYVTDVEFLLALVDQLRL